MPMFYTLFIVTIILCIVSFAAGWNEHAAYLRRRSQRNASRVKYLQRVK